MALTVAASLTTDRNDVTELRNLSVQRVPCLSVRDYFQSAGACSAASPSLVTSNEQYKQESLWSVEALWHAVSMMTCKKKRSCVTRRDILRALDRSNAEVLTCQAPCRTTMCGSSERRSRGRLP